ncbi:MAG: M48 family metallopeptidase [Nitrococcus mobilis]|nr:M48 family metallopeptidase [Nitrococcus mobilis]
MRIIARRTGVLIMACSLWVTACATSPTGRSQLKLFPEQQVESMGTQAYKEMKQKQPIVDDPEVTNYVRCVADAITRVLPGEYGKTHWEVTVFRSDQVNAFALPGGKIGVYSGLLKVAQTPAQLATVIGHEVGHVLAGHANERLSTNVATQTGLDLLSIFVGTNGFIKQQGLALLGLGAQVGVILPFSRTQESEADEIGEELMAKAGFDPRQSIELWQNMSKAGGEQPPQFLSTHPSPSNRIEELRDHMPQAMRLYERARFDGRNPQCARPAAK